MKFKPPLIQHFGHLSPPNHPRVLPLLHPQARTPLPLSRIPFIIIGVLEAVVQPLANLAGMVIQDVLDVPILEVLPFAVLERAFDLGM